MESTHEQFIRKAIELAVASGKEGNHTFGAVLVHEGEIIATAGNTAVTGDGYGHAEYNLVLKSAEQVPDSVLQESTLYTSTAPCNRCSFAILAAGIKRIVYSVSYEGFARVAPDYKVLTLYEITDRLNLTEVEIVGPILEEEGLRAFEYWGGEYRPLAELLDESQQAGRQETNG